MADVPARPLVTGVCDCVSVCDTENRVCTVEAVTCSNLCSIAFVVASVTLSQPAAIRERVSPAANSGTVSAGQGPGHTVVCVCVCVSVCVCLCVCVCVCVV